MSIRGFFEHAEMGVYVLFFRGASWTMPIKRLVRLAVALADRLPPVFGSPPRDRAPGAARRAARRVSRLVPGATCLHRALASRVWLARRGVATHLVVGFRNEGAIEGHAWLEVDADVGEALFVEEGYRASFSEGDLVPDRAPDEPESVPSSESQPELEGGHASTNTLDHSAGTD